MDKDLIESIEKSGHNLHMQVTDILERNGWSVDISPYYVDDIRDKPREIDIIATKTFSPLTPEVHPPRDDSFKIKLFIECKYFTKEIAARVKPLENPMGFLQTPGFNKDEIIGYLKTIHRYPEEKIIAKLFDAHKDVQTGVFDSLTTPIKSMIFHIDHRTERRRFLAYPITVFDGFNGIHILDKIDFDIKNIKNVQYLLAQVNYSYKNPIENKINTVNGLVEFVHKDVFENLLGKIRRDGEKIKDRIEKKLPNPPRKKTSYI